MNATQLLVHFDRLAEAPGGVPRLRRFILDLAVRGKLVEQDAGDEPAVELLKRIRVEKTRFVKAGKLKRGVEDAKADDSEPPFVLPRHWVWAHLGEVAQYGISDKVDSNASISSSTWVLDLEDIEKDTSRLLNQVESEARPFSSTKTVFKQGDVLFGKLRPYLNKVIVADRDGVCTTEIIPIRGYCGLAPEYTNLVLRSPLTMATVDRLMYGMKMPRLGTADGTALSYPLPPLAEQHRIVAKVDELMTLCDQLEAAQQERERRRDRLSAASLQRLNQPAVDITPEDQREYARFHLHHLTRLTTRPEHIKAMRQTVLNFAVQGRLLVQDQSAPSAGSTQVAGAALQRLSDAMHDDPEVLGVRFCLPTGWFWRTGDQVADFVDPQPSHRTPPQVKGGIPYIGYGDIKGVGSIDFANARKVSLDIFEEHKARYVLKNGDFVIGKIGTIGQPHVLPSPFEYTLSANLILVQPSEDIVLSRYLVTFFSSPLAESALKTHKTDSTHAVFGIKKARLLLIPTPPLAEQHRIVAKVDELMALCDQLEAQLTIAQTDSRLLLEAVLDAALSPA